jgi:hypothetical protein
MNSGFKPPYLPFFVRGRRVGEVRRGPLRSATHPGPRQPDLGLTSATEEIRCHTLEFATVGPAFGDRLRHGGCGATTESSPGAPRRSNSPPIPDWSPRSPTSLYLDPPRTRSCFRQPGQELTGLLAVTTHRRRGQPPFPRSHQRNSATIASTAASLAALLVLITISRLVRLLSPLRREPPQKKTPDVADQLNESTPTDQHLYAVGGQTLCAGWAMNRPVCATCRSRRRRDKDVLALRADQSMRTTPRPA